MLCKPNDSRRTSDVNTGEKQVPSCLAALSESGTDCANYSLDLHLPSM
jgi:hypothetical protein